MSDQFAALILTTTVEAELYHGATKYGAPEKRRAALDGFLAPYRSLAFDSICVPHYARIRDHLDRAGQVIGGNDLMIAAIALAHGLTVVTHNCGEFQRVPGLRGGRLDRVGNWFAAWPGTDFGIRNLEQIT